jgi:hypothetical protein
MSILVDQLTKREKIAAMCLQGLLSNRQTIEAAVRSAKERSKDAKTQAMDVLETMAGVAVSYADALLIQVSEKPNTRTAADV